MTTVVQPDAGRSYIEALRPRRGVYVGGESRASFDGAEFAVEDPGTEELVTVVADGGVADARMAVDAAAAAFPAWASTPPRARSEVLRRAFELMVADIDALAVLISRENGKPVEDARGEVAYAAEFFRWFAEEAVRTEGSFGESPAGGTRTIVTSRPVGAAALVTPWNFPAAMATRKIAPALAAGCTVVFKPAAETPLTALAIARILSQAGAPDGVVNLVPTSRPADVVTAWLSDDRVRKLSFTGSTGVGRTLLAQAADRVLNASMELGGNAPFIVAADAEIAKAVTGAMQAKFRNGGQVCTAANRFYVHESVSDAFVAEFGAAIESQRVGNGFAPGTMIGPMISGRAVAKITSLVNEAVRGGARVTHRAEVPAGGGHFYPPTLLVDVPADAAILHTEIFGPVAPIVTWREENELIAQVNSTEYGLSSYVYSRDLKWALQIAERIESGIVGVNRGMVSDPAAPFGGVKQSGLGREGGREGIREFCETRYFSVDWS